MKRTRRTKTLTLEVLIVLELGLFLDDFGSNAEVSQFCAGAFSQEPIEGEIKVGIMMAFLKLMT